MSDFVEGDRQHHFQQVADDMRRRPPVAMGVTSGWVWYSDPRRLGFALARYKFVAKMLDGAENVLEVGCGDGFFARVVAQAVGKLTAVDIEPDYIASAQETVSDRFPVSFAVHDMVARPFAGRFDGLYSLDVLEHIAPEKEDRFLSNLVSSLTDDGTCIVGMPSIESQDYASEYSKLGHVNCKDQPSFKRLMLKYFRNVYIFSMNDEVVHTGFGKMSHYNIALCCGKRS